MAATIEQARAGIWTPEEWGEWFEKMREHWASTDPDEHLVKLADRLFEGNDNKKVYFPCCGNSADMKWAYELGYEVVGTDCNAASIEDFFISKAKMKFVEEKIENVNGVLYKMGKAYCLYSSNVEGPCGAIVDSGAITSINLTDLPRYVEHLVSMMTPNCRLMLYATEYDESVYPAFSVHREFICPIISCHTGITVEDFEIPWPPHNLPQSMVEGLFGSGYKFECLKTIDMMDQMQEVMEGEASSSQESENCSQEAEKQNSSDVQDSKQKSERELKDEVFNQMTNLKSLLGRYLLITKS